MRLPEFIVQLSRTVTWHRRLVAGGLAAGAVALTIHALEPSPEPGVPVVTAANDLPGSTLLQEDDLAVTHVPDDAVPDGAVSSLSDLAGQQISGPVRAGEIFTDVRLVGRSLLDGWGPDLAAVPVRIADPAAVRLARPGDVIDIIAADVSGAGGAHVLAAGVPVLAVPSGSDAGMPADGALLVVAATPAQVRELAGASVTSRLSIALTSR
ncbi:MAG TPA: SAF domain-containing protein [Jiangellaceae bacterium]